MNANTTTQDHPRRRRLLAALLVPALAVGIAACDTGRSGMSSADAAAIREQIEQVADRLDAVERRLLDLSAQGGEAPQQLISEVRSVRDDVGEAREMLTEVSQQLADEQSEDALEPLPGAPLTPLDDGLGTPGVGDDLDRLGDDVRQGVEGLGDDLRQGLDDAGDRLDDALDADGPLDVAPGQPRPLEDPLVPDAPGL